MANRILIVEDEPDQVDQYRRAFAARGYAVACAGTAEEGLALADASSFDAILTDNHLPGMMGLEAIPEFKRRSTAPIMMMTSHWTPEDEKNALLLGAIAVLKKPLDLQHACAEFNKAIAAETDLLLKSQQRGGH
jgi:DNA-binding response OmpR family regulator